ncbi:MAG: response regulator transcription factor [Thermomicrobiales bacterium]
MTLKLLIAEDTSDLANAVAFAARMAWPGCQVTIASDGEDALARFAADPADLVVLDVGMPPPNGFEVCRRIREVSEVPILMLTVRDATVDKVRALDLGADDYLTKPFDHLELLARLRALLRRAPGQDAQPTPRFVSGELSIDFSTHEVRLGEEVVRLTTTEYRLLEELARHAGVVMPHDVLLERVWGAEWITQPNYLKVFIQRLRRKLGEDAENPRYIQTEWGIGYRFVHPH